MPVSQGVDGYLQPFVATNNFSGSVLVTKKGQVVFERSFGFADREARIENTAATRFHIASMSLPFTAFAVMRLVEQHKLSLETPVGDIVGDLPNGSRITVRELLEQNSGLPDANDLPNYDALLRAHQTPDSVVQQIRGLKPLAEPGGESTHEEHSAYNVLALIIERKTGLPFAHAMQQLVFQPAQMLNSGADDDSPIDGSVALGYNVTGEFGLKRADAIHWSAKPGNGSDYSTVTDVRKWFSVFMDGKPSSDDWFGWEKIQSRRFGETFYLSSGRAPGFSSVMVYFPSEDVTVIVLGNIEHAMSFLVAQNIAAIIIGKPFVPFADRPVSLSARQRHQVTGAFTFGSDFYRPNATLVIGDTAQGLVLNWPGGPEAPLLPIGANSFIDRYYWNRATVVQDAAGRPVGLTYGTFEGRVAPLI